MEKFFCRKTLYPILLIVVLGWINGALAAVAGKVEGLRGQVWAQSAGKKPRDVNKGDVIFSGDRVTTSRNSSVRLRFADKSKFEIGPEASMVIDEFVYDSQAKSNIFSASIFKGVFRFVTGLVARKRPAAMKVTLPVATIGIRGTHVVGEVHETSAKVILVEPETGDTLTAIDVGNDFGSVVIDEPGFGTEIPDEHSPPSPPRRMHMRTINNLMRSLQSLHRISVPRPRIR